MARAIELEAAAERFALAYDRTGQESSRVNCLYYMLLSEVAKDEENGNDETSDEPNPFSDAPGPDSFGCSRIGSFARSERVADGTSWDGEDHFNRNPC